MFAGLLTSEPPRSRPDHRWSQELIDPDEEVVGGEFIVP